MARKLKPITITWSSPIFGIKSGDRFKVKGYSNKYVCIARVEPHWQNKGSYQRDFTVWEKHSRGYAKHIRRIKANARNSRSNSTLR